MTWTAERLEQAIEQRYIVLMDGPRSDGCVVEIEEGDQDEEGFWQDIEQGRYTAKLMPRGATRKQADAELEAWLASINAA